MYVEKTQSTDGRLDIAYTFASIADATQFAVDREMCPSVAKAKQVSSRKDERSERWDLMAGWNGAVYMGTNGWRDGGDDIRKNAMRLTAELADRLVRKPIKWDMTGRDFDISRVVDGVPEQWYYRDKSNKREHGNRIVTLEINLAASAGVDADVLNTRGVVMTTLAMLLERSGKRVRILAHSHGASQFPATHETHLYTHTTVKQPNEPLDIDRVAFAVAHPAFFRRQIFSIMENCEEFMQTEHYGYGRPAPITPSAGSIYVPEAMWGNDQWTDATKAKEWVLRQLKQVGVSIRNN